MNFTKSKWDVNRPWRHLYNATWRNLRTLVLARDPVCVLCRRNPSTVADHIKDHKGDTKLFYDMENLRGVCKACHDEKTGRTSHEGQRQEGQGNTATIVGDFALDAALNRYKQDSCPPK